MPHSLEAEKSNEPEFRWGSKKGKGGKNKEVQFYGSFIYDGMNYALYDSVYMYNEKEPKPYIGKLVKIWENADRSKRVKVHWFFRPSEISYYLNDEDVVENELFLASGAGDGLCYINPLESVAGKCNVVCTSKDPRNPQPTTEELEMADYVFYRIFDVARCIISDQIGDNVGGLEGIANFVFNKRDYIRSVRSIDAPEIVSNQVCINAKLDKNGNCMLEEKDANVEQELLKLENLHGESSSRIGDSSESTKLMTPTTSGTKSAVCEINFLLDEVKDMKLQDDKERVKSARKVACSDDIPSKKVKFDCKVSLVQYENRMESLPVSGKDIMNSVIATPLPNETTKSELAKHYVLSRKNAKAATSSGFPLSKETPTIGDTQDNFGVDKDYKITRDSNVLEGRKGSTSSSFLFEKKLEQLSMSCCAGGTDKNLSANVGTIREGPSTTYDVSPSETVRSLETNLSPGETLKSRFELDVKEPGQATNFSKSISNKRLSPIGVYSSEETPNHRVDACRENKTTNMGKHSCLMGGVSKKAKFDDHMGISEDIKKSSMKRLKGRNPSSGNTTPQLVVISDANKEKSRLDEGTVEKFHDSKVDKISNHNGKDDGKSARIIFKVTRGSAVEKRNWIKLKNCFILLMDYDAYLSIVRGSGHCVCASGTKGQYLGVLESWEDRIKAAQDEGKLVLLQNLDPRYTSGEVEDIIWHALKETCTAKIVPHTAMSNPDSGQAFVIFDTRELVHSVVKRLDDRCLMLPNKREENTPEKVSICRPLVARAGVDCKFSDYKKTFYGHLSIDKARRQIQKEMREAVSTSHYSQNNTIEYDMAMAWCVLQLKFDECRKKLYLGQRKDLKKLKDDLKLETFKGDLKLK